MEGAEEVAVLVVLTVLLCPRLEATGGAVGRCGQSGQAAAGHPRKLLRTEYVVGAVPNPSTLPAGVLQGDVIPLFSCTSSARNPLDRRAICCNWGNVSSQNNNWNNLNDANNQGFNFNSSLPEQILGMNSNNINCNI